MTRSQPYAKLNMTQYRYLISLFLSLLMCLTFAGCGKWSSKTAVVKVTIPCKGASTEEIDVVVAQEFLFHVNTLPTVSAEESGGKILHISHGWLRFWS